MKIYDNICSYDVSVLARRHGFNKPCSLTYSDIVNWFFKKHDALLYIDRWDDGSFSAVLNRKWGGGGNTSDRRLDSDGRWSEGLAEDFISIHEALNEGVKGLFRLFEPHHEDIVPVNECADPEPRSDRDEFNNLNWVTNTTGYEKQ